MTYNELKNIELSEEKIELKNNENSYKNEK